MAKNIFYLLGQTIDAIKDLYNECTREWSEINCRKVNLKGALVCNVESDDDLRDLIFKYRSFIKSNDAILEFMIFNGFQDGSIDFRVKTVNSIEYKVYNYIKTKERGKISINKCLNDLFGLRIILPVNLSKKKLISYI